MLARKKFRRRTLSMTSLIDVIFLLLLFFMLSSTFSKFGEIDLVTASGSAGATRSQEPPIFIKRDAETLTVNGQIRTLEEAETEVAELHEKGADIVILSIGETLTSQVLIETMVSLTRAAPVRITLVQ
ncbi:MAG: biopolymer transporter ExbD [Pseudomonadota bacterium]